MRIKERKVFEKNLNFQLHVQIFNLFITLKSSRVPKMYVKFYEKLPLTVVQKSHKFKVQAHLWQLVFLII